jgi:hemerythrin
LEIRNKEQFKLEMIQEDGRSITEKFQNKGVTEEEVQQYAEKIIGGEKFFTHFKRGDLCIRVGFRQELHGGEVYTMKEPRDFNYKACFRINGDWGIVAADNNYGRAREALWDIEDKFAAKVGSHGQPRLWRGLRQIQQDDIIGAETLTLDWTDQKRTCKITINGEMFKTVVDNAEEIITHIEAEYGLTDLYMCDAETGEPVDYRTNFDGGEFTVHQACQRPKGNRAVWSGEENSEKVIKGVGIEIKRWIKSHLECKVDLYIIREGLIPVYKELILYQDYDDVEFLIVPKGDVYKPEYEDCSQFSLIRDPDYQTRRKFKLWQETKRKKEEFVITWFRDHASKESQEYHQERDRLAEEAIQEWREDGLLSWCIEEEDPKEITGEGMRRVRKTLEPWAYEYW